MSIERKEETKMVKAYLVKNGYQEVKVTHGKGTAWGWLHVAVTIDRNKTCYCEGNKNQAGNTERCHYCRTQWQEEYAKLSREVMALTGRTGEYGGCINYEVRMIPEVVI